MNEENEGHVTHIIVQQYRASSSYSERETAQEMATFLPFRNYLVNAKLWK